MKKTASITSLHNADIKHVALLARDKQERFAQKKFVAEGIRTCRTLIEDGTKLVTLYSTDEAHELAREIAPAHALIIVADTVMKKMSTTTSASGILGVFEMPPVRPLKNLQHGIVLEHLADPGNMGTLIRTAVAMQVPSIVIIGGADPFSPKVVQASAGTIGRAPLFHCSWHELQTEAQEKKISLCALIVSGGAHPSQINFKQSLLIVGSEAHGIADEHLAQCTTRLTLPMPGNVESLNAAIAASIALYLGYNS